MITDWKKEIAVAWYVQNETAKIDTARLWDYHLPRVAATERELAEAEALLRHPLDPRYREFLRFANGWPCFFQRVDLFGTAELRGDSAMQNAYLALEAIDSESLAKSKVTRSELLPIGFSNAQNDLFLLLKANDAGSGAIIWFAGYEVERFPTFDEFFLAMVDYNRLRFERLRGDKETRQEKGERQK